MPDGLFKYTRIYDGGMFAVEARTLRTAVIFGIFIYSIFAILDPFMLPIHYKTAWFIRFCIIAPGLIIVYFLTYLKTFLRTAKPFMLMLLILGQLGIIYMIYIAEPVEEAYYAYYAGLILVILWSEFIFRFTLRQVYIIGASTVILYNLISIFSQELIYQAHDSREFAWFLGNNFFLISAGILSIVGAHQLNNYKKKVSEQRQMLISEGLKLKEAKEKAEESDRLKTAFLNSISHEIRTPLNAILGFSSMISDKKIPADEKHEYSRYVHENSNQLLRIVDDIIRISKIKSEQVRMYHHRFRLTPLLEELEHVFAEKARLKKLQFGIRMHSDDNSEVITDKEKLKVILYHLIDNAIKFTEKGRVELSCEQAGKKLNFMVSDTGIGIHTPDKNKIFDIFTQLDGSNTKNHGGSGLGLSIVREYIRLLGGEISLKPNPGGGTVFYFHIPLKDQ